MRRLSTALLIVLFFAAGSCSLFLESYDGPVIVSHGYVEGVTPANTPNLNERDYLTVQANWEGPGGDKLWLAANLGATGQPETSADTNPRVAGWYFQFNRKQGFYHNGSVLIPQWTVKKIEEDSNWEPANDPCRLLLGDPWRIPTRAEMNAFRTAPVSQGGMGEGNRTAAFNSDLKLHAAGYLHSFTGELLNRGENGSYWTSEQVSDYPPQGEGFGFGPGSRMFGGYKAFGRPVRCIKDE